MIEELKAAQARAAEMGASARYQFDQRENVSALAEMVGTLAGALVELLEPAPVSVPEQEQADNNSNTAQ